jgi:hypothetical protein
MWYMASLINQTQLVKNRQMPFIWNQGCPWIWQQPQDVLVDAGFVHKRLECSGTLYIFKMLYQGYMTELPLSVTYFKILHHLMCDIVAPAVPSPCQTSITVVFLSSAKVLHVIHQIMKDWRIVWPCYLNWSHWGAHSVMKCVFTILTDMEKITHTSTHTHTPRNDIQ